METYSNSLTTLLQGNKQASDELLNNLKEMANTTPFETSDLLDATQTMLGYGMSVDDSTKALKQLGDISMGDSNKLSSLTLAFSQVSSTGKLTGQDLLQMINAGFNPLSEISKKTGESIAELKERMSGTGISAQEVSDAMATATSEGGLYYQAMDTASETSAGKISTLKDQFNQLTGSMTTSLMPIFQKAIDKLTEFFNWLNSLDEGTKNAIVTIALVLAAIGPVLLIIAKVITAVKDIKSAIEAVHLVMTAISIGPMALIVTAIVAIVAALVYCYNKFEWFRDGVNNVFKAIVNTFIWMINLVTSGINMLLSNVLAPFNAIIRGLNMIPGVNIPTLSLSIPKIPMLNIGTDLVNQDGLAYLHKGESVVPANVASGGYSNGNRPMVINVTTEAKVDEGTLFEAQNRINYNKGLQTQFGGGYNVSN